MLTLQLLRVRTRNGAIFPLFCTKEEDIELAKKIIHEFQQTWKNKERKAVLEDRISTIEESDEGNDYKLVRGLYALLERRCTFKSNDSNSDSDIGITNNNNNNTGINPSVDPPRIRKAIFEESSRRGFALTELERQEIASTVASKFHLPSHDIVLRSMWSDLDDNLILEHFDTIGPEDLVGWYNLSLMQTLLFNCTKLDFYISGGLNWKRVLRTVKRLGLMYHLQQPQQQQDNRIICSLEGPLSLFKLTDRYGTLLAKLLPSIIFASDKRREDGDRRSDGSSAGGGEWHLDAWIIRKTMEGRKIYEFKISNNEIPQLLADPYPSYLHGSSKEKDEIAKPSSLYNGHNIFDSVVEEKFAKRFEQAETGWRLTREPDPLVLSNGGAFIPDFVFEKYDRKIYLEIVGFWTKEYLERKLQKLADIFISSDIRKKNKKTATNNNNDKNADLLFIAVNEDFACSKSSFSLIVPKDQLIFYKNDTVPIKPIIDYLKSIDREMIERKVNDPNLKIELGKYNENNSSNNNDDGVVISISEIAKEYSIPAEVARRISLRDNKEKYIEAGMHLIPLSKARKLESLLVGTSRFIDACLILSKEGIPESCHADLIAKLGYNVRWQSLDPSTAVITKSKE
jgi:predicted nuclease of restriction endonuclease-like RecB superfamily